VDVFRVQSCLKGVTLGPSPQDLSLVQGQVLT